MKNLTRLIILTLFLFAGDLYAKTKVQKLNLKQNSKIAALEIQLESPVSGTPEIMVRDNIVQVTLPNAYVWPKIERKAKLQSNRFNTTLTAYQYSKNTVRVRAILPYNVEKQASRVFIGMGKNRIDLNFPVLDIPRTETKKLVLPKVTTKKKTVKKIEKPIKVTETKVNLDEGYLAKLLKEEKVKAKEKSQEKTETFLTEKTEKTAEGKGESTFSLTKYFGKFAAFLGLVLVLFYFIVNIFKKGFNKKGKLGFLNSTKVIEVLNTTYISPKKSILIIRAHNQVFLIGSTEKGIHLLSELKDMSGLLKNGEKDLTGTNFDTNLTTAEDGNKDFKLKEILTEAQNKMEEEDKTEAEDMASSGLEAFLSSEKAPKEKVTLSDKIKKQS